MRIVTTNTLIHTEGRPETLERGPALRRRNVEYERVRTPVAVPPPQIEDLRALVVVNDRMEYYS